MQTPQNLNKNAMMYQIISKVSHYVTDVTPGLTAE